MLRRTAALASALFFLSTTAERLSWCPEPWPVSQCIPTSGAMAQGPQVATAKSPITWEAGLAGHSHYPLASDGKPRTAVFIIDPQNVYAACPGNLTVEGLLANPSSPGYAGHSPMCCEKFFDSVANANRVVAAARNNGYPVFVIGHVYRDLDGDGSVDNCGRLCDYDVAGWAGWPEAWNLWHEDLPYSAMVYANDTELRGFKADFSKDFYAEKSIYSAFTQPVSDKLRDLGVDHVIITGFMTQYCVTTTARVGSDLGFRVTVVTDAIDGPLLLQLLSGIDENVAIPLYLGVAVADTITTEALLTLLGAAGADTSPPVALPKTDEDEEATAEDADDDADMYAEL